MLIILFGLAAVGKNYVGLTLSRHADFNFFDGDELLSEEMKQFIREKKTFTEEMRDFLTLRMIKQISELQKQHQNIVFAQALYKEKNREQLRHVFPEAKLILIESKQENIITRLQKRNDWIDAAYAEKMRAHFDVPHLQHSVIQNDAGSDEVIKQLQAIITL